MNTDKKLTKSKGFGFGTQIRKSPYFDATLRWGAETFPCTTICIFPEILVIRSRIFGT
jgi:hypothetical protein